MDKIHLSAQRAVPNERCYMTDDRKKLAEENMGLAYMAAHKYKNCGIEFDDLVSICFLGLVKAANNYDCAKAKFATYSVRIMDNEVLMALRKRSVSPCISLDAEIENGGMVAELIPDGKDYFGGSYMVELYREATQPLSDNEKRVVHALVISGDTQEGVGNRLGLSQSYVSRIYKRAVRKMRLAVQM